MPIAILVIAPAIAQDTNIVEPSATNPAVNKAICAATASATNGAKLYPI